MINKTSVINLYETVIFAWRSLLRNKLQSFLTMLGIIFGIAAVITMMAKSTGTREQILRDIGEGINTIIINSVEPPEEDSDTQERQSVNRYGLTFKDAEQIKLSGRHIAGSLAVHSSQASVLFGRKKINVKIRGVDPKQFRLLNMENVLGRLLSTADNESQKRVCLVTPDLLNQINYIGDPTDLSILIKDDFFQIVGVVAKAEFTSPGEMSLGIKKNIPDIYLPYEASLARFGTLNRVMSAGSFKTTEIELDQLIINVSDSQYVLGTARMIQTILEKFHDDKQDYEMIVPLKRLRQSELAQRELDISMMIIASISLLVGGIGIINIMLATITERTREIGIRRALGATRNDIVFQFLIETILLSSCGGLLGCLFGILGSYTMDYYFNWPCIVTAESLILSVGISCSVGVIFGMYPARRAAFMDPITALRHE